ncbi:hypothetical protein EDD21DRAFT_375662 [Dissophora ornata]|nr:hypothetical protein EDD21DRAFT_375662 [Dissophora ornata]
MSQTTLAELSLSLSHVQSLLKQITAEVKVLSDGIAVLAEQEEAEDVEEELSYLDVDPWSNVNDKDKNAATASRRDSIRSLMQRRPSTVKDETKALARILSQKHAGSGSAGSGSESEKLLQGTQPPQQHQLPQLTSARWSSSTLQEQIIDEDCASSEGSSSYGSGNQDSSAGDKQELEATNNLTSATTRSLRSASTTPQPPEAERVPHTITVQTTQTPTKFPIAITKPNTPHSPSTPVLSTSASQSSILNNTSMPLHYRRSTTTPNTNEGSRSPSVSGSITPDGYLSRSAGQANAPRRSLQPEPRSSSDNQIFTPSGVTDRYTQAIRSNSQGIITHPPAGMDAGKSTFTINSPKPLAAAQAEKMDSADCFSKLGLSPELLRGIYAYGLKMPSILQQRGIPMIMTRHDVLTQAKPEVAKTLTYAIPLLNFLTLPATSIHPQLLILCSNYDLCLHVQRVLLALARFMPTISCLICAEGNNATLSLGTISTTQVNTAGPGSRNVLSQNRYGSRASLNSEPLSVIAAHVVIGTPAKVLSLIRTKQISLAALKVMVLENADILLTSPLKEATVSLLSMVRDQTSNIGASESISTSSDTMISPPNLGPTSPVSKAVAALNGRIMGSAPESRPRSLSGSSGSSAALMSAASPPTATNQPQLLFFSTEVPAHVLDHVAQYMTQPTKALVKGHELALKGILQFFKYMAVEDEEWQLELLYELLEDSGANRVVVFCNSDGSVERVVRKIRECKGFAIGVYSDMDIASKKAAMGRFRGSAPPVYLILTDEVSKDLDILVVPLVVSFEIPSIGNYIPRVKWIDRSKGKVGAKVTLIDGHKGEGQVLRAIQQHYRTTIDDMPVSIADFIVN